MTGPPPANAPPSLPAHPRGHASSGGESNKGSASGRRRQRKSPFWPPLSAPPKPQPRGSAERPPQDSDRLEDSRSRRRSLARKCPRSGFHMPRASTEARSRPRPPTGALARAHSRGTPSRSGLLLYNYSFSLCVSLFTLHAFSFC